MAFNQAGRQKQQTIQFSLLGSKQALSELSALNLQFESTRLLAKKSADSVSASLLEFAQMAAKLTANSKLPTQSLKDLILEAERLQKVYNEVVRDPSQATNANIAKLSTDVDALYKKAELAGIALKDIGEQNSLQKAVGGAFNLLDNLTGVGLALQTVQFAFSGVQQAASLAYSSLIGANEELTQKAIRSATIIAGQTDVIAQGVKQGTIGSIEQLKPALQQLQKELQLETINLAGVTSDFTNEVFSQVTQNFSQVVGQTKGFSSELDAVKQLTIGITAAAGTIQLPQQQLIQEVRALLTGDVNNPDSLLPRAIGLDKAEFNRRTGEGEKLQFILEKLKPSIEGNSIAADTLTNSLSNIQDGFMQLGMTAGEPFLQPVTDAFKALSKLVSGPALVPLQEITTDLFEPLANIIVKTAGILNNVFGPSVSLALRTLGANTISAIKAILGVLSDAATALELITKPIESLVSGIIEARGEFLKTADSQSEVARGFLATSDAIGLAVQGYRQLVTVIRDLNNLGGSRADREEVQQVDQQNLNRSQNDIERVRRQVQELRAKGGEITEADRENIRLQVTGIRNELLNNLEEIGARGKTGFQGLDDTDVFNAAETQKQLDDVLSTAEKIGIKYSVELAAKATPRLGKLGVALKDELNAAFQTATDEGSGSIQSRFAEAQDRLLKASTAAFEAGVINSTKYIEVLKKVATDERSTTQQRIEAQKLLTQEYQASADTRIKLLQNEQSIINSQVATGRLTSQEGETKSQLRNLDIAKQQKAALEQQLIALKALNEEGEISFQSREFTELVSNLKAANAKVSEEVAKLYDARIKENEFKFELSLAKAQRTIQKANDARQLELAESFRLTSEQIAVREAKLQQQITIQAIQENSKRLAFLEAQSKPKSQDAREEQERKIAQARTEYTQSLIQGLNQEETIRKAILAEELKTIDLEAKKDTLGLTAEQNKLSLAARRLDLEQQAAKNQQENAQLILDLQKQQLALSQLRVGSALNEQNEVLLLFEKLDNANPRERLEIERQLVELGASPSADKQTAALQIATKRLELQEQARALELQQTNLQLETQRRALEFSILQEASASRRAKLESDIAVLQQKIEISKIKGELKATQAQRDSKAARGIDTTEEDILITGKQEELGSAKSILGLREEQQSLAQQQINEDAEQARLRRNTLATEQEITKERLAQTQAVSQRKDRLDAAGLQDKATGGQQLSGGNTVSIKGTNLRFANSSQASEFLKSVAQKAGLKETGDSFTDSIRRANSPAFQQALQQASSQSNSVNITNNFPAASSSRSINRLAGL